MAVLSLSKCIQMARLSSLYGEVPFGTIGYKGLKSAGVLKGSVVHRYMYVCAYMHCALSLS